MAKLGKRGQADAVISAGNTGACVAAFQMRIRNLPGVIRPGIAVVFPTPGGPVTICDVGANIACKPIHLYQYGIMASIYSKHLFKIENPRVGIMSIGEEEAKGNETVKKTRELIKADKKVNFIGNIEGRDIFQGKCDVIICEGFVGNVILKLTEGLVDGLFRAIKHELMEEKIWLAMKFKPVMTRIYQKYDYNEYGGALLLGINGTGIICHGSSQSKTIKNAILASKRFYTEKINDKIVENIYRTVPIPNSIQSSKTQEIEVRILMNNPVNEYHPPYHAIISGHGSFVPEKTLTNEELAKMMDTSDEWITTRTGIKTRHITSDSESTAFLATEAAKKALAQANLDPKDLELIIVATITPEMVFPSTAGFVQLALKAKKAWCCDLAAACSGFIYTLIVRTAIYRKWTL